MPHWLKDVLKAQDERQSANELNDRVNNLLDSFEADSLEMTAAMMPSHFKILTHGQDERANGASLIQVEDHSHPKGALKDLKQNVQNSSKITTIQSSVSALSSAAPPHAPSSNRHSFNEPATNLPNFPNTQILLSPRTAGGHFVRTIPPRPFGGIPSLLSSPVPSFNNPSRFSRPPNPYGPRW